MQPNKFIVIEGGDGSGKTTQVELLCKALEERHVVFSRLKFPQKEKFFGSFVYECLDGKHGNFLALDPYFACMSFMLDHRVAAEEIQKALSSGYVVTDRYVPSNLAHQAAKLFDEDERRRLVSFIEQATYGELGAVGPDLVIYLDVPADISMRLLAIEDKKDQHEADFSYQERVRDAYRTLTRERKNWHRIDCVSNGTLRSPEEIHHDVIASVFAEATS